MRHRLTAKAFFFFPILYMANFETILYLKPNLTLIFQTSGHTTHICYQLKWVCETHESKS